MRSRLAENRRSLHPAHIDNAFLNQFDEFKQFKERARVSQSKPDIQAEPEEKILHNETETPDEIMRRAHTQINAALAQEL